MNGLIAGVDVIDDLKEVEACDFIVSKEQSSKKSRKLYIESYGCQMNFSDSEIVTSILKNEGFDTTANANDAEVILINTCSIREKAEQTIRNRLNYFNSIKKKNPLVTIGVLGCMAERLKAQLLEEEKIVDLVVGPDAYRDLPKLLEKVEDGEKGLNTFLSKEETYADISPVRLNSNGVTAYISIMRGCDNMCSFCVVPFTRGRERSRDPFSIVQEAQELFKKGYREVTLLGQNVDSFSWSENGDSKLDMDKKDDIACINFSKLLEMVAAIDPDLRVRFSTSHPKDITDDVLFTIKKFENICNYIHLPAQSGNSRILQMMNRTYDRDWYIGRVDTIREILGEECGISSDMITGFCSETEEEHQDTLSLMDYAQFDYSYMFFYSERPGTLAAKKYPDDIPLEIKKLRLQEVMQKQNELSLASNQSDIGKTFKVLVEGASKKSGKEMQGRNSANKVVIFPSSKKIIGQYVNVYVDDCSGGTLFGKII